MTIKKVINELCSRCGAVNARVEGDEVITGHDCPHRLKPPHAPPMPRGARYRLSDVIFVPAEQPDADIINVYGSGPTPIGPREDGA